MSKRQSKTPLIYALEPRLLFDGDLGADVASAIVYRDGNATDTAPAVAPENQRETQRENISFEFHVSRSAIVFIDGGVEDPQTLADAAADVLPDDAQIHILDGDSDGFAQINDILQNHDRVDEIHIFGHGTAGEARLGTASLSLETLTTHSDTMAVLKDTLTEDGDILLYGCNIAAGDNGQTFIEELAELTAADIAASDDITGAGGDWELEASTGPIEVNAIEADEYAFQLNNAPTAADNVVTVGQGNSYTFDANQFGFADADNDTLAHVEIVSLPTNGTLEKSTWTAPDENYSGERSDNEFHDAANWTNVSQGETISLADLSGGRLRFTPAANASGSAYASFSFKVNDGSADSASVYTMTVNIDADADKVAGHTSDRVVISNDFTNFASGSGGNGYGTEKIHIVKENTNVFSGATMNDFAIGSTIVNDAENRLDSYLIFRNGELSSSSSVYIDFDTTIAGVYTASYHSDNDGALDAPFAKAGATYPVRVGSDAIESPGETVSVSGRRLTLNWDVGNSSDYDAIRVFVWSGKPAPVADDFDAYTSEDNMHGEWRENSLTIAGGNPELNGDRIDWRDHVTSNNGAAVAVISTWLDGDTPPADDYSRDPTSGFTLTSPHFQSAGGEQLFRLSVRNNDGLIRLDDSATSTSANFEEQAPGDANLTYRLNYRVMDEFGGTDDGVITVHVQPANDAPYWEGNIDSPITVQNSGVYTLAASDPGHPINWVNDPDHADSDLTMLFQGGGTSLVRDHGTWSIGANNVLTYTPASGGYLPIGSTVSDYIGFTFEDPDGLQSVTSSNRSHTQYNAPEHRYITFSIEGTDTPVPPTAGSTVVTWDGGPASDASNAQSQGAYFKFDLENSGFHSYYNTSDRWSVTHTAADNSQPDSFIDTFVGHNGANVSFNGYIDPTTDEVFASEPSNGNFITFDSRTIDGETITPVFNVHSDSEGGEIIAEGPNYDRDWYFQIPRGHTETFNFEYEVEDEFGETARGSIEIQIQGHNDGLTDLAGIPLYQRTQAGRTITGNLTGAEVVDIGATFELVKISIDDTEAVSADGVNATLETDRDKLVINMGDNTWAYSDNRDYSSGQHDRFFDVTYQITYPDGEVEEVVKEFIFRPEANNVWTPFDDSINVASDAPIAGDLSPNDSPSGLFLGARTGRDNLLDEGGTDGGASILPYMPAGTVLNGQYGTLEVDSDFTFTYTPNEAYKALAAGEQATDTFSYAGRPSNPQENGNFGIQAAFADIVFNLTGQAADWQVRDDFFMTLEGTDLSGAVLANDYADVTLDGLLITLLDGAPAETSGTNSGSFVATGTYGSLVLAADGSFVYTAGTLSGVDEAIDTFTVTIEDANGNTQTSTLRIKVTDTTDFDNIDEILTKTITVTEGETQTGSNINQLASGNLSWSNITGVAAGSENPSSSNVDARIEGDWGWLTLYADGTYTYESNDTYLLDVNQQATDTFTFTTSGLDGHNVSGEHKLIVTIDGVDSVASLSPFTIQVTEDTTYYNGQNAGYIEYFGMDKYEGVTSALDAPNQVNVANGWMHYIQDEFNDITNNQYIRSVNGYGNYGDDEYRIEDTIAHIGPSGFSSDWMDKYTVGEDVYAQTMPNGGPLVAFQESSTIKVMAPDVELAAGETLTIEGNEVVLGRLYGNAVIGTFTVEIVGLADPQPVLEDDNLSTTNYQYTELQPGSFQSNTSGHYYVQDDAENVVGKIRFWFGEHTGFYGNTPNYKNVVTVTGNDSISTSGTLAVSVYDADTEQWSDYIDADQDTIVTSTWGTYQWEDYAGGRILEYTQNDAFAALYYGTHVDQFKYRFTPLDTSLDADEAEVTVNLKAIDDPINMSLPMGEWIYALAGTSTQVLASAANVGTASGAGDAVVGDHSGGVGLAGTTKRDPDGDGSVHVYRFANGRYSNNSSAGYPETGIPKTLSLRVYNHETNEQVSTSTAPTLTVTDGGDYTLDIPDLPKLGNNTTDYRLRTLDNGTSVNFWSSNTDQFASLDIYVEGNEVIPTADNDFAAVFEDENVAILNTSTAANMSGGDNASAVDLPGEHTGNLLLNDSDTDLDGNPIGGMTITHVKFGNGNYQSVSQELVETAIEGTYGTLNIYHDGTYNYTADKDAADPLTPGETVVDTFTYKLTDSGGFTDEATLAITVHGVGNETYDIELVIDENTDLNFLESTFPDLEGDEHNPPIVIQTLPERGTLFYQDSELTAVPQEVPHANLNLLMFRPDTDTHGDDGLNNQPGYAFFTYSIDLSGDNDPIVTVNIDVTPDGNNSPPTVQTGVDTPDDTADDTSSVGEVTTVEDTDHVFDHSEFNFYDPDDPTSDLTSITITGLPSTGKLFIDGVELTADNLATLGADITKADIDADKLVFRPNPDENGDDYATFTFTVSDGLASSAAATMTVNVTPDNDPPTVQTGVDTPDDTADDTSSVGEVTTVEDTDHVFDHSEFNFYDPDDPTSDLTSITITGLPSTGKLFIDGVELTADNLATLGADITKADIDADKLVFRPNPDENGDDYATFTFTVSDGLASSAAATMTVNVTPDNDPPTVQTGVDTPDDTADDTSSVGEVTTVEDTDHVFDHSEFNFYDPDDPTSDLTSITITGLPSTGKLFIDGVELTADNLATLGADITKADIDADKLVFRPNPDENGDDYATFTFTVSDGLASSAAATMTVNVTPDNDPPTVQTGVDTPDDTADDTSSVGEVTTVEDTDHVFDHSEFNFYDPDDPTSDLTSITITGLPSTGKLFIDGVELTADNLATLGADITKADIDADKLVFRPNPDENGDDYATFTFTVSDGLASSAAATMTVNVTPDNDPPTVQTGVDTPDDTADDTSSVGEVTTVEDTDHVFDHSEFNFYDPDDPTSDLTSITITGLPSTGKLFIDGVELTADNLATLGADITKADIDADKLVFRPNPDENGDDYATFTFTVSDGLASSAAATMTVNVTPVNDPPEADPIVETRTKLDAEFSVNLVTDANATDIDDGDVLVAINDGDESDDEPIATFTRTGTTRVMVTADSGLYLIDDAAVASGGFALNPGRTYIFDWSGATDHPVRLSETADGTHGGGVEYVVGVTVDADAGTTTIVVSDTTPTTLYAYCENHAAMGFGTPVEAYDVPDSSYTLSGSTLTVDPQVFADLASDNEVEIAIAYKIADGDVADDATYVIDNTATITITGLNTKPQIIDNYNDGINDNDVANVADVTTPEDTTYVFTLGDFNYVDQDNDPMASVLITQGPLLGELTLNDVVITDPVRISRADIEAGLLKYTPPADENGNDYTAFSYAVNDGKVDSDVGAMTIHVTPVNDPPEADPIVETRTKLDAEFSVNLVTDANATDIDDGDVLVAINDGDESDDEPIATFTRTGTTRVMVTADSGLYLIDDAAVASGGFALNPGRTYIFDWSGATDHPVRLSETADGTHGGGVEYVVGVTVDADAGTTTIVVSDTTPTTLYAYCENHAAMGFGTPVEAYDVPDSSYTLSGSTLTVDPQVFADLASDNEVEIAIAYKIADGDVADDATYVIDNTATITITGLNTKPQIIDNYNDGINDNDVANVADVTTPEDTTYVFTLGDFNYVDQDNDPMASVLITQGPLLGELTLNDVVITDPVRISRADIEAGLLKYTPPADENGNDYTAFSYAVNDGKVDSDVGAMTIHVTPVNDPPEADPIVETRTKLDAEFSVNLVTDANATDIDDGDVLVAINDGDESDDEPIATFTRTGTTRVMVTADSGLYLIDDAAVASGGFALNPGRTYIFDWSGATDHPVRLSETADGTHGGGVEYVVGVTVDADAGTTTIVVSDTTPTTLYAYCENHAAMGFGTPVEAYDVPDSSYTLSGSTLTVDPQVFADLASDNEVEIAIAYKIADGDVADDATYVIDNTATITITGLNTKPQIIDNYNDGINDNDVANVADVTTPEDTTYVFTLGDFNYVDQDNDPMASVLITQGPLLGELTLNDVVITDPVRISRADIEAGLLKYTPPADENGNDYTAFSYAVNDGKVDSDVGAMTIHVTPVNDPPEADPIVETRTKLDAEFSVNLVTDANATDIDDGDVLVAINDGDESDDEPIATFTRTGTTRVMVTADSGLYLIDDAAVASGGFALNPGRTYIFDWSGATDHPVRLSETADGTHGGGVEYVVGVTVDADAGTTTIVVSDTTPTTLYAYCENHAAMGFGTPVEAYDVPDSSYTLSGSTLTVDPQVFADLASDNEVEIAIAYKIADGDVADDATYVIDNTATITITGLNTKPQIIDNYNDGINDNDVANVADVTTPEDTTYVFTLGDFNYVDQDNDPMASVLITQGPLLGELTLNDVVITDPVRISRADIEAGLLKYTPPADENGNDYTAFSYAVNDGKVDSDVGAMTIHVTPVNDPPQSADKFVRILGERTVQFGGNEFSFRDTDDGDTLNHITLMSLPSKGVLYLVPYGTVLPAIIDPPMDPSWAITDIAGVDGRDILKAELSSLIYVANETVKTQSYDAFTFTVNDGSQRVPGPLDSEKSNQITLGKVIYFEPRIDPEPKEPAKKDRVKPKEKRPELNPHDLPPVLKVAVNLDENRQLRNEPILNAVGGRELGEIGDDNAGLADDSWMNAKTSMQPDISGNIRVIDLKVEGREIAVQITDEASDRAERFKGELPDGSPLPSWVKVDQKTGLTIADPPPGTQPFEMRVVAEDGAGNARAIDLVLDPTLIAGEGEANTEPANDKVANNAASDSVSDSKDDAISAIVGDNPASQPNVATRGNNLSSSTVDVLSDGSVVFDETATLAPNGSLRLLRMVNENDGVKIEINDDAQESATRYEVRQKDGSAAPDWVKVDVRTGELTIEAPQNIDAIELTIIALDGGEERRLDVDVDLDETPVQPLDDGQDAGQDDLKGDDDQTSEGSADKQRSANALPVNEFVPLDAQIDKALSESSYGRDIQQAAQSLS